MSFEKRLEILQRRINRLKYITRVVYRPRKVLRSLYETVIIVDILRYPGLLYQANFLQMADILRMQFSTVKVTDLRIIDTLIKSLGATKCSTEVIIVSEFMMKNPQLFRQGIIDSHDILKYKLYFSIIESMNIQERFSHYFPLMYRKLSDLLLLMDNIVAGHVKIQRETIDIDEIISHAWAYVKSYKELWLINDVLKYQVWVLKTFQEMVTLYDILKYVQINIRIWSETVSINDIEQVKFQKLFVDRFSGMDIIIIQDTRRILEVNITRFDYSRFNECGFDWSHMILNDYLKATRTVFLLCSIKILDELSYQFLCQSGCEVECQTSCELGGCEVGCEVECQTVHEPLEERSD